MANKVNWNGSLMERFSEKVQITPTCWLWLGAKTSFGYGRFRVFRKTIRASRFSYAIHRGPVPDNLQLDHLCKNPTCVNPWHLEPVTPRENVLRSEGPAAKQARQTHCKYGHLLAGENLYSYKQHRYCKICRKEIYPSTRLDFSKVGAV